MKTSFEVHIPLKKSEKNWKIPISKKNDSTWKLEKIPDPIGPNRTQSDPPWVRHLKMGADPINWKTFKTENLVNLEVGTSAAAADWGTTPRGGGRGDRYICILAV